MSVITLTDKQNRAANEAVDWYFNRETNGKDPKRIFTIAGYAGTGKSTLAKFAIEKMGLDQKEVAFCAYTGMAANVLMRKGNSMATTIHKLIYDAIPVGEENGVTKFIFELKKQDSLNHFKLLVVDEVSMVPQNMLDELKHFGIKIMALGDSGQLPPIGGSNDILKKPDVFLDEILRQALENPIIHLSMLVREGKRVPYGPMGDNVMVIRKNELEQEMFMMADQIIAGKNATVDAINKYHRRNHLNIENPLPVVGDKIICLKNDWNYTIHESGFDVSLVNGLIGKIQDISDMKRSKLYNIDFKPDFLKDASFEKLFMDKLEFYSETSREGVDQKHLYIMRKGILDTYGVQKFKFGYCITTHKSQGSEFPNVLLFNEILRRDMARQQAYTGVTRASEKLIYVL
jgi:exodeoxyribonuclease V